MVFLIPNSCSFKGFRFSMDLRRGSLDFLKMGCQLVDGKNGFDETNSIINIPRRKTSYFVLLYIGNSQFSQISTGFDGVRRNSTEFDGFRRISTDFDGFRRGLAGPFQVYPVWAEFILGNLICKKLLPNPYPARSLPVQLQNAKKSCKIL